MLTQKANLANLVTTVPKGRNGEKGTTSLTDSFQSFVTVSNTQWGQGRTSDSVEPAKPTVAETSHKEMYKETHKEAYEKETVSADTYSVSKEKVQNSMVQKDEPTEGMEITDEQMEALENDIRNVLKETLDMDDAELDEILAVMNLNILNLLEPGKLQEFLLVATESEPMDLITDSAFVDVFQQMNTGIEDVLQEYGLSETDWNQILSQELPKETVEEKPTVLKEVLPQREFTQKAEEDVLEQPEVVTEQPEVRRESKEAPRNEHNEKGGFTVKEEASGITVSVESSQPKENQDSGRQMEHTQQGIATEIVNHLSQAVEELEETPVSFTSELQQTEIIRQVIEQIRVVSGSDLNRIEVQLYPQHLGRVQIQVMMKNGFMTAQIHAETEMAKEAIEGQLQQLKDTFQEKSIRVEAVEVSVGTSDFQREQERQDTAKNNQEARSGRRRIRLDAFGMPMEEAEDEETASELLEAQGASVEFTA